MTTHLFQLSQKFFSGNLLFLAVFNFWGHFEGLNEVLLGSRFSMIVEALIHPPKWISSMIPFQRAIMHPKRRSYAKVTPPGIWYTKLSKMGSTKLLAFHFSGLGFWNLFMLKIPLEPHCNRSSCECECLSHFFSEISYHHSSESFTLYFYSFVHFSH